MPFRRDFVGSSNQPGIFRRSILAKFIEGFLEPSVELAVGAIAVEIQRDIASRWHVLVYAGCAQAAIHVNPENSTALKNEGARLDALTERLNCGRDLVAV